MARRYLPRRPRPVIRRPVRRAAKAGAPAFAARLTGRRITGLGRRGKYLLAILDDGRLLTYNDPRRFGRLAVLEAVAVASETGTGLDPLAPAFTAEVLFALT